MFKIGHLNQRTASGIGMAPVFNDKIRGRMRRSGWRPKEENLKICTLAQVCRWTGIEFCATMAYNI